MQLTNPESLAFGGAAVDPIVVDRAKALLAAARTEYNRQMVAMCDQAKQIMDANDDRLAETIRRTLQSSVVLEVTSIIPLQAGDPCPASTVSQGRRINAIWRMLCVKR